MHLIPAAVTPFEAEGRVDEAGVARLLSWFKAGGATGVVVAGTTGEGPSLSMIEKRDLVRVAVPMSQGLPVWLGVATSSFEDAVWLAKEAGKAGAAGILLMPPTFYRTASTAGLEGWFRAVLDRAPVDVLLYNFPRFTGLPLSTELLTALADHPRFVGLKDSSGEAGNLEAYAQALPGKRLLVGDETLLGVALAAGWHGTISGAANVLIRELAGAINDAGESRQTKLEMLREELSRVRSIPQPMGHKQRLVELGVLNRADVRLPLQ